METPQTLYTVRDVARIFGLHESRVRYWAQTGFINPSGSQDGKRLYTFGDLVGMKAAKELLDRGIPLQRVRKNLQALREALPQLERPLQQLRVCSDGEQLVVAHRERAFEPVSGQLVLDFEIDDLRSRVAELLELKPEPEPPAPSAGEIRATPASLAAASPGEPTTAYEWFLQGCAHDRDPDAASLAQAAYERAIVLDDSLAAAHTNLGNVLYQRGDRAAARRCYQRACELDPDQPEARFNLANLHDDDGRLELAVAEHRRALGANPDFADAHFNLALALERLGSHTQALAHWQRYLELSTESLDEDPWRAAARAHVDGLSGDGG
jgi:tetratricopeptide (TPR) repeat protein